MKTFRTTETQQSYDTYKEERMNDDSCWICSKPTIKTFAHWRIVENSFPYDRIASVHHLLTPLRHVHESELTEEELQEFVYIKENELDGYELLTWSIKKYQSVPNHYHVHALVPKDIHI